MDTTNWSQRCQWFTSPLGKLLLAAQSFELMQILPKMRLGRFALIYHHQDLFSSLLKTRVQAVVHVTPQAELATQVSTTAVSLPEALPFLENTMSMVILPHVLEFVDDPKETIAEAANVLAGQGLIVITGMNPMSFWGLKKCFQPAKMPYLGRYISAARVRRYLKNCDCQILKTRTVYFRVPVRNGAVQRVTRFMEVLGRLCWPAFGGAYVIVAQKIEVPLIPLRERWRLKNLLVNKGVVEPTPRSRA